MRELISRILHVGSFRCGWSTKESLCLLLWIAISDCRVKGGKTSQIFLHILLQRCRTFFTHKALKQYLDISNINSNCSFFLIHKIASWLWIRYDYHHPSSPQMDWLHRNLSPRRRWESESRCPELRRSFHTPGCWHRRLLRTTCRQAFILQNESHRSECSKSTRTGFAKPACSLMEHSVIERQ